ncbi:MAG: hypothetical protein AAGB04_13865 [Pseudomonadota bacterium]
MSSLYQVIMDPSQNPLRHLPKLVRFQIMTSLALMWSGVFSLWIGYLALFGPSAIAHLVLLLGLFFTADVFRRAQRSRTPHHRDAMRDRRDGTVLYDDLWGGV